MDDFASILKKRWMPNLRQQTWRSAAQADLTKQITNSSQKRTINMYKQFTSTLSLFTSETYKCNFASLKLQVNVQVRYKLIYSHVRVRVQVHLSVLISVLSLTVILTVVIFYFSMQLLGFSNPCISLCIFRLICL